MRQITFAAAIAALGLGIGLSAAFADDYYGPRKQGNLCFKHQTGNSLGYWGPCEQPRSAQAAQPAEPRQATQTNGGRR